MTDFGGPLTDSGQFVLDITLSPGEVQNYHLFHSIEGGAFASGSSYSGSLDATLSFSTQPVSAPIPEPSTLPLLGSGLAGLAAWRYRKTVRA